MTNNTLFAKIKYKFSCSNYNINKLLHLQSTVLLSIFISLDGLAFNWDLKVSQSEVSGDQYLQIQFFFIKIIKLKLICDIVILQITIL